MEENKSKRRTKVDIERKYQDLILKRECTVGVELFNQLVRHNDKVRGNNAYKHALYYMVVDRDFIDSEGHVLIPDYKIAVWCGSEGIREYIAGNFKSEVFLKQFKKDVLHALRWSEPVWIDSDHATGKCRHIINETIADLVDFHLLNFNRERYSMVAGSKYNIGNVRRRHNELVEDSKAIIWPYPDVQTDIAGYLHDRPLSLFTKQVTEERVSLAKDSIVTSSTLNGKTKRKELRALHYIADMPKPFYKPAKSHLNARLFTNASLCTIDREARRILCNGWYELDLKACYPSIAASIWNIKCIQDMLANGIDVWNSISHELGIPHKYMELSRDAVKALGCRLLCGGLVKAAHVNLGIDLADLGIGIVANDIESCPTLVAIINAVKVEGDRAKLRGYTDTDTSIGRIELPDRKAKTVRSHLANVLSAYELALIAPCFEVAKESTDFTITMLQHDGISIRLDKGEDRLQQVVTRLNKEVASVASRFGILTSLVCKG